MAPGDQADGRIRRSYHDSIKVDGDAHSGNGVGETFASLLERRINRRGLLRSSVAAGTLVLTAQALTATKPGQSGFGMLAGGQVAAAEAVPSMIAFQPIPPQPVNSQQVVVASGHRAEVLLKWGQPILPGAPAFNVDNQTRESQEKQFGYNCDYVGWHPLPPGSTSSINGLLWVNHEYTNPELMFDAYDADNPTEQQVNVELAAHGGAIVELRRDSSGKMVVQQNSSYNRRITGFTPIRISGPAAGHDWMKTTDDPTGTQVAGTLNNCAGGITPWGTVLTCEENFHQYFGNLSGLSADDPRRKVHARYGMPVEASDRLWELYHSRFDITDEPNEGFRFGWVVEIDPYDPQSMPIKRTALGRFRHEGATFGFSPSGKVVFYSGDDERFEYIYKYVSTNPLDPSRPAMEQGLLDEGTLYVAKYHDDGTGEWLPIVYGQGPLTAANGFNSQGDVLINTRGAADLLGATKMDRPEDMQQNPVNKKIYAALTNNTRRTADNIDQANPRPNNATGHIIEMSEEGDDAAATRFTWDIFMLCGKPDDPSSYFAGFPKDQVSPIAAPDNVNFDLAGNLWLSTDGQPSSIKYADALHVVPTSGPERGRLAQFLSVVEGAECASFDFTRDNRNLFVSVQHPGEGGIYRREPLNEEPGVSTEPLPTDWPDGGGAPPKPAVVQVWAEDRGRVGGGPERPISNAAFYRTWERTDKLIAERAVDRTWIWGPWAHSFEFMEEYVDAPIGMRPVQYFEKSRMEVNDHNANANWEWYVTNGLLAKELTTGRLQLGRETFQTRQPAAISIAGDLNDANAPTYATFTGLMSRPAQPVGASITQTIDRAGNVGNDASLGQYGVTAARSVSETNHTVASVFWTFMNSAGPVSVNGQVTNELLFESPFYATGLPISEAYWARVKVNGVEQWVLVQVFERRVLTYTPRNPKGWKVETGNVGRHYFTWRYGTEP